MVHENLIFLLIALIFMGIELIYFRIADRYNIIDHPNERSSHSTITLRGGGVIFPLAMVFFFACYQFQYPFFILGLVAISCISFLDDAFTLNNTLRLSVHLLSVGLLFYQWGILGLPWYWLLLSAIIVIGTINAYNFMDGINGITGLYSVAIIISLLTVNARLHFMAGQLLIFALLALVIFLYFNFPNRKQFCLDSIYERENAYESKVEKPCSSNRVINVFSGLLRWLNECRRFSCT